jgi:tripartite-type tricarboxylate transporter receptor subunit TctC
MAGRRTLLAHVCIIGIGIMGMVAGATDALAYPTKPITIVVPAAPGGVSDTLARTIGQRLSEVWNQQVIIENRGGANHQIGAAQVAKAPRDGHMLMLGAETIFVINPILHSRLPYAVKDFAPVTGLVRANQALLAHKGFAPSSVGELIALAKSKPGTISYGTSGVGSAGHVNVALLESMAGVKLVPVHYRGAAPALNDVIAGHIQLTSVSVSAALQPSRNGLVKMLGIGSAQRLPGIPNVPTVAESGVPGYEATTWFGLFSTAGTPREVVLKINAEVQRLFKEEAFRKRFLEPQLFEVMTSAPEQFEDFIAAETKKWSKVIRDANLKVD